MFWIGLEREGPGRRQGHADANFSVLRRMALSMLKNNHSRRVGIKNKRMIAALDEAYLTEVLLGT